MSVEESGDMSVRGINMKLKHQDTGTREEHRENHDGSDYKRGLNFDHIYRIGPHRMATINVTRNDDRELCVKMRCLHCDKVEFSGVASELAEIFRISNRGQHGGQSRSHSPSRNASRRSPQERGSSRENTEGRNTGRVHGPVDGSCEAASTSP